MTLRPASIRPRLPRDRSLEAPSSPHLRAFAVLLLCCTLAGPSPAHATPAGAYDQPPPGPALSLDALDPILAELATTEIEALSFWDRLWQWLVERFSPVRDDTDLTWLNDFRVSDTVARWIFYLTAALIVLLGIGIVVNELRHANAFRRRRKLGGGRINAPDVVPSTSVEDLLSLPLSEQPAMLLRLILARLENLRDRQLSLTHREIVRATIGLRPAQSQPLHKIANFAERIRYGGWLPQPSEIEPVIGAGRALLSELPEE